MRSGPWKLHVQQRVPITYNQIKELDSPELYHLEADISERHDVAVTKLEIVQELQKMIDAHQLDVVGSTPDQLDIRIEK